MGNDVLGAALLDRMASVPGLLCVCVSDRDGVVVVKAVASAEDPKRAHIIQQCCRPSFLSTYSACCDQTERLGLGTNSVVLADFEQLQVVHLNVNPLVLTLVSAGGSANTGQVIDFAKSLSPLVQDIAKAVIKD